MMPAPCFLPVLWEPSNYHIRACKPPSLGIDPPMLAGEDPRQSQAPRDALSCRHRAGLSSL